MKSLKISTFAATRLWTIWGNSEIDPEFGQSGSIFSGQMPCKVGPQGKLQYPRDQNARFSTAKRRSRAAKRYGDRLWSIWNNFEIDLDFAQSGQIFTENGPSKSDRKAKYSTQ